MPGFKISVPGSSANIGSGFDTLGFAQNIRNTLIINTSTEVSNDPTLLITASGKYTKYGNSTPIEASKSNLVYKIYEETMQKLGKKMPKEIFMEFELDVPISRGLGSSTTAILMGMFAAFATASVQPNIGLCLQTLMEKEGHLDNGAPSLLGGITVSWINDGAPFVRQNPINPNLELKLIIPTFEASTKDARDVLPPTVFREDAVHNVQRVALLMNILMSANFSNEDLMMALDDKLHQDARKGIYPQSYELMNELKKAGYPTCISGAGPTLLTIVNKNILKPELSIEDVISQDEKFVSIDSEISPNGTTVEPVG